MLNYYAHVDLFIPLIKCNECDLDHKHAKYFTYSSEHSEEITCRIVYRLCIVLTNSRHTFYIYIFSINEKKHSTMFTGDILIIYIIVRCKVLF